MKHDGHRSALPGRSCLFLLLLVLAGFCGGGAWAHSPGDVCGVDGNAVTYLGRVREWSPAIEFQRVRVAGMKDVFAASRAQRVDFPQAGAQLQFFYVRPQDDSGDGPMLVGCLHYTDAQGRSRTSSQEFDSEGGEQPVIAAMLTAKLSKGQGNTLLLILKWESELSAIGTEGYLYRIQAFGMTEGQAQGGSSGWNERTDLEQKIDNLGGFDGTREGKQVTYPYKDKESLIRRLRALGYMK